MIFLIIAPYKYSYLLTDEFLVDSHLVAICVKDINRPSINIFDLCYTIPTPAPCDICLKVRRIIIHLLTYLLTYEKCNIARILFGYRIMREILHFSVNKINVSHGRKRY